MKKQKRKKIDITVTTAAAVRLCEQIVKAVFGPKASILDVNFGFVEGRDEKDVGGKRWCNVDAKFRLLEQGKAPNRLTFKASFTMYESTEAFWRLAGGFFTVEYLALRASFRQDDDGAILVIQNGFEKTT